MLGRAYAPSQRAFAFCDGALKGSGDRAACFLESEDGLINVACAIGRVVNNAGYGELRSTLMSHGSGNPIWAQMSSQSLARLARGPVFAVEYCAFRARACRGHDVVVIVVVAVKATTITIEVTLLILQLLLLRGGSR